jgi:hypothetical protein
MSPLQVLTGSSAHRGKCSPWQMLWRLAMSDAHVERIGRQVSVPYRRAMLVTILV